MGNQSNHRARKLGKLVNDPVGFLLDSRFVVLRRLGRMIFDKKTQDLRQQGIRHKEIPVTVIMTAYNTGQHIGRAVKSLQDQTHSLLEILIVNDASTDDTAEILNGLAAADPRIRVFHVSKNTGTYSAKNFGLQQASHRYVTFHDSDDTSDPERIRMQLAAMLRDKRRVAVTVRWSRHDAQGTLIQVDGQPDRLAAISLMIDREKVLPCIGYFDSVRIAADTEYLSRIRVAFGPAGIKNLRQRLYFGLLREDSLTMSGGSGMTWEKTGAGYIRHQTGDRAAYLDAAQLWHSGHAATATAKPLGDTVRSVFYVDYPLVNRPFPAPPALHAQAVDRVCEYNQSMIR